MNFSRLNIHNVSIGDLVKRLVAESGPGTIAIAIDHREGMFAERWAITLHERGGSVAIRRHVLVGTGFRIAGVHADISPASSRTALAEIHSRDVWSMESSCLPISGMPIRVAVSDGKVLHEMETNLPCLPGRELEPRMRVAWLIGYLQQILPCHPGQVCQHCGGVVLDVPGTARRMAAGDLVLDRQVATLIERAAARADSSLPESSAGACTGCERVIG